MITIFTSVIFFNNFKRPKLTGRCRFGFPCMRRTIIHILILCCITVNAKAQESISADKTSGCDSLVVEFTLDNALSQADYTSIVWSFGDGTQATGVLTVIHTYLRPGVYDVRCQLDGARNIDAPAFISLGETPRADFIFKDTSDSESDLSYYFQAAYFSPVEGMILDYTWVFPDNSEVNDSIAVYSFAEENIYEVSLRVKDNNGCADTILKKIPVSKQLMIPNVFSPNGDEINDYFVVTTSGEYIYSLHIFSPAGLQVYASSSPRIQWDGRTAGGTEAPQGVYFYIIESDDTPVPTELSGFIHLFR